MAADRVLADEAGDLPGGAADCEVVGGLEVEPELGRSAERHGEPPGEVRVDGALATDDGGDVGLGDAEVLRQLRRGTAKRGEALLTEDLAGVSADAILGKYGTR